MARSKAEPPKETCRLQVSVAEANAKLEERVKKGAELRAFPVRTPGDVEVFNTDYKKWDDYNESLLKSLFTTEEEMLKYRWSVAAGVVVTMEAQSDFTLYRRRLENVTDLCRALESLIGRLEVIPLVPGLAETPKAAADGRGDDVWDLLHPHVRAVAQKRFEAQHYADAVEASLKALNAEVQRIAKQRGAPEMDGTKLMHTVFSPTSPVIALGDLGTQTGRDMQQGYMEIFAGAMSAVRNPKAHGNVEITSERGMHFLFLTSMLWYTLDDRT